MQTWGGPIGTWNGSGIPAHPDGGSGYALPDLNGGSGLQPADARFRPY